MTSDLQGPPRQGPPTPGTGGVPDPEAYSRAQTSPQFVELRRRYRGFAFPMTVAFLVWYFMFVLAAVFAPEWMATPVWGNINIGIIFGLLQFVSTGLITFLYVRHANNRLDPLATEIRDEMEGYAA
ncbi:MAG TPA: DUF485 domain-containing protein [Candidatus Limnocylindrales bacterium]|jgi:uncharacterized membrane protein (DUF485 family)|nr:DUF485 domain-containing protein [Candidatus Limnocylindrales bacterium]